MPQISVIITTYNLEKYIGNCLTDLKDQTYQDYEVIVVDDCSKDDTRQIIDSYQEILGERLKRIYLTNNQGFAAKTRNIALDYVTGKYFLILDGDDRLESNYLEALYELAEEKTADIAICAYDRVRFGDGHVFCKEMIGFPETINLPERGDLLPYINGAPWNKLFRTDIFKGVRSPLPHIGDDVCFMQYLYFKCKVIAFTDEILIHYAVRDASAVSNIKETYIHEFAEEMENILLQSGEYEDIEALNCFVHIGISMPLRAWSNPDIDNKSYLNWTYEYLKKNKILSGHSSLRFSTLCRKGIRGLAIWSCKILYQIGHISVFLKLYHLFVSITGKDIKF